MTADDPKGKVRKVSVLRQMSQTGFDDGDIPRLIFGISGIRSLVFPPGSSNQEFDKYFGAVMDNLRETAYSKYRLSEILQNHSARLESGEAAEMMPDGKTLNVHEDVDLELNVAFKDVFLRGSAALSFIGKMGVLLGHKITFIYENDKEFEKGSTAFLQENDSDIMKYLVNRIKIERTEWYSKFRKLRDDITHDGWKLPVAEYILLDDKPTAVLYQLGGQPLPDAIQILFTRLVDFCEDSIILLLATKLPLFFTVRYVEPDKRTAANPGKYIAVPTISAQAPVWDSYYKKP